MIISCIIGIVLSYLLGSIPFGYLIAITKGIDIRTEGSGNIGATNVSRVLGRKYGLIIFFLDMFKAFAAVFFVPLLFSGITFPTTPDNLLVILCGFSAILGHAFPVFLKFRGGKAVATCFGVFIWLAPLAVGISFGAWVITVLVSRYVSLGSMIGTVSLALVLLFVLDSPFGADIYLMLLSIAVTILVIAKHTSNIQRIVSGTEKRVFAKKK
ncbi:MAG: glycerol-3-phosphate 1-O-acyltransferase PlsY [Candidatus Scalindua sp.]|jgi:glycerol-3-phosphate acyltransferase PlsY|nr:glycerol-3-phosphate 1-O-acyltransferase PlsY [Candidatus Scalindua sp.]MDV5166655.1 glycerol-3-phosphate 1-O-acyltransferase PlsY [Candidatus Scalindua sp.]